MRKLTVILSLCIVAFVHPHLAQAWDDEGHMAVAYVAYQQLTPATKARVKDLLAVNPYATDPDKWPKLVAQGPADEDPDELTFMIAATWPDEIKRDKTYVNDGPHGGDRPPAKDADRNTGYDDHARHKYWHFVDTPFSTDGTTLPSIPTPNAQTQIIAFRKVLKSTRADALKSYDLSWLLHLVGDVHQPLHCATRVSATEKDGDAGGNNVKLTICPTCELHAFWDQALGTSTSLVTVIKVAKRLPKAKATATANLTIPDWVAESFGAAKATVYMDPPIGPGDGPFTPTTSYRTSVSKVAEPRIALAGERLAKILNTELK